MHKLLILFVFFLSTVSICSDQDENRPELKHSDLYKSTGIKGENENIDKNLIVDQKKIGICYACAPYPTLMAIANLKGNSKLSIFKIVMLGTKKTMEYGGFSVAVLQNIKDADFNLSLDEAYDLREAMDFKNYISSLDLDQILAKQFNLELSFLPKTLQNIADKVKVVLQEKIKENPPSAAYDTLLSFSGDQIRISPYNIYVYYPDSDEDTYEKLFELLKSEPSIPVMFNYKHPNPDLRGSSINHAISLLDIRIAKDCNQNNIYEIKVVNNWGEGPYNGWFKADAFIKARSDIDPIIYIKLCNNEKSVSYVQGNFAPSRDSLAESLFRHAAFHKNYIGIKALIKEKSIFPADMTNNIYLAVDSNDIELLTMMIEYSDNTVETIKTGLFCSIYSNKIDIFNELIYKIDNKLINSIIDNNKIRNTLLHEAVRLKRIDMIEKLLALGADPSVENKSHCSAIDYADFLYKSDEILSLLKYK